MAAHVSATVATPTAPTSATSTSSAAVDTQVLTRTAAKNLSKAHGQHTAKSSTSSVGKHRDHVGGAHLAGGKHRA